MGEANNKLDKINELDEQPYREKLVELNGKLEEKQNQRQDLFTHITESKLNLHNNKEKLSKLGTEEDTCPVCLRPMEEHNHEIIEKEKIDITFKKPSFFLAFKNLKVISFSKVEIKFFLFVFLKYL